MEFVGRFRQVIFATFVLYYFIITYVKIDVMPLIQPLGLFPSAIYMYNPLPNGPNLHPQYHTLFLTVP